MTPKRGVQPQEGMQESVARFEQRRRRWRGEGPRALVMALTVIGIGWTIAIPTVLGFLCGHWLDQRYRSGVVLSAGLGMLGLTIGCYSAWRHIAQQRESE